MLVATALVFAGMPSLAINEHGVGAEDVHSPYVMKARDTTTVEEHGGYTSEYIFGLSKGVMRSTLVPALKPAVLLLTVPLDIVFLPFAAIGGFLR